MRRWKEWSCTPQVLNLFGKKEYDGPLMRRAILRYALCCKDEQCQAFLAEARRQDGETVKEVEESLQYEK
jgi:hypothetical protein